MRRTVTVTLLMVGNGLLVFLASDQFSPKEYALSFSDEHDLPILTTIQGVPFPTTDGHVTITEPLAHLRLPFGKTILGKHLVIRTRFRVETADDVAVGVKKGTFWLDYDRQALFPDGSGPRRIGDEWMEQERQFDLSSAYLAPDGSLELMFFVQQREEQPRLVLDELRLRIKPGAPTVGTLVQRAHSQLATLIRRPLVTSRAP